jgi:hypothetical protein
MSISGIDSRGRGLEQASGALTLVAERARFDRQPELACAAHTAAHEGKRKITGEAI